MSGPDDGEQDWPEQSTQERIEFWVTHIAENYEGKPFQVISGAENLLFQMSRLYPALGPLNAAFRQAMDRYRDGESRSLDEAFKIRHLRKDWVSEAYRFKVENGLKIYSEVTRLLKAGGLTSANKNEESVFQKVAKNYPRGPSSIRDIYYAAKRIIEEPVTITVTFERPDD